MSPVLFVGVLMIPLLLLTDGRIRPGAADEGAVAVRAAVKGRRFSSVNVRMQCAAVKRLAGRILPDPAEVEKLCSDGHGDLYGE
jgi:hypothetical protein